MRNVDFQQVLRASQLADHAVYARWFARGLGDQGTEPDGATRDYERGAWRAGHGMRDRVRSRVAKRWARRILRLLDRRRKRELGNVDFIFDMPWDTPGYSDLRWPGDVMWHFRDKTIRDLEGDTWAHAAAAVEWVSPYPLLNLARAFRDVRKRKMFAPTSMPCAPDWAIVGFDRVMCPDIRGSVHGDLARDVVPNEGMRSVIAQNEEWSREDGWMPVIKSVRHGHWDTKKAVFRKPVGVDRVR